MQESRKMNCSAELRSVELEDSNDVRITRLDSA